LSMDMDMSMSMPSSSPSASPSVSAAPSCVDNVDDLKIAVANATALDDPALILLCLGTYNFTEPIDLSDRAIHLRCLVHDAPAGGCVLNGNDKNQIFIAGAGTVQVAGFNLQFKDLTFTQGRSTGTAFGGAVGFFGNETDSTSSASFDNCTFTDNVASQVSIPSMSKNQKSGSFTIANRPLCLY
jgi:hypothetical protein